MQENLYDLVVDELVARQRLVKDELKERFRKTKPFRMEPVSNEELLNSYNRLTPEDIRGYIQTYGREAVNEMVFSMEKLKARRIK